MGTQSMQSVHSRCACAPCGLHVLLRTARQPWQIFLDLRVLDAAHQLFALELRSTERTFY